MLDTSVDLTLCMQEVDVYWKCVSFVSETEAKAGWSYSKNSQGKTGEVGGLNYSTVDVL